MNKKITLSCIRLFFLLALSCFAWNSGYSQCTPFFSGDCQFPGIDPNNVQYNFIDSLIFSTINIGIPVTSCDNPSAITQSVSMCVGATDTMTIFAGDSEGVAVFIDTSHDGAFQPDELFYSKLDTAQYPYGIYTFPITIAPGTHGGTVTMRVMGAFKHAPDSLEYCLNDANVPYGNYYDIQLNIIDTLRINAQPTAVAGCIGGPVTFKVVDSNSGVSYQWFKYEDTAGTPINGANSATYTISNFKSSDTGYYYAVLTNMCSMQVSDSVALTIKPAPPVNLVAEGPTSFCPGGKVALTGSSDTTDYKFSWLYNGALTSDTTLYDTVGAPGAYAFIVSNGCTDTSHTINVINFPISTPTVSPAGLTKVCEALQQTQVYSTPIGTGVTYQWQVNTGLPNVYANIPDDTLSYITASATGYYRVVMTDSNNCVTTSLSSTLQENNPATVDISTLSSLYLCAGGYITLRASSSDTGEKFRWQFNNVPITPASGATGATYNAFQAGTYTVIGNNGCEVTSTAITLSTLPFPTVIPGGPTTFCGGGSVLLSSGITDTNSIFSYQWQKNGVNIPGATATTYTAMDSGLYSVFITSDNTCTAGSTPVLVTVYALPNPSIILGGDGLTLTVSPNFAQYQWYYSSSATGTPVAIANATLGSYVADTAGYYTVAVKDDHSCTGTSLAIYAPGVLAVGTVANPESISVYPNPATSIVRIDAPVNVNVSLTTMDGRVVLSKTAAKEINIQQLADGIYLLRVADENGNTLKIEKLVKSNQ